jgi:hypothetical protein
MVSMMAAADEQKPPAGRPQRGRRGPRREAARTTMVDAGTPKKQAAGEEKDRPAAAST